MNISSTPVFLLDLDSDLISVDARATNVHKTYDNFLSYEASSVKNITQMQILHEIGFKIRLISRAPKINVQSFFRSLGLGFDFSNDLIFDSEDLRESLDSNDIYMASIKQFKISPEHCILFSCTNQGIELAKKSKMYTVALSSQSNTKFECQGAHEIVPSILDSKIMRSHAYDETQNPGAGNAYTRCLSIQRLSAEAIENLVDATYQVYVQNFQGRSRDQWKNKICDSRDYLTRACLIYISGRIVGYGILKFQTVEYENTTRIIALASAGILPVARSGGLILQLFQIEARRLLLSVPQTSQISILDNFLGPNGYMVINRLAKTVYPSRKFPVVSEHDRRFMQSMAPRLGYTKAGTEDPEVYYSSSQLRTRLNSEQIDKLSPDGSYILGRTGINPSHGLYTIVHVRWDNLLPLSSQISEKSKL